MVQIKSFFPHRLRFENIPLLHPFMPFITEELYQSLPNAEETIMRASWPKYTNDFQFAEEAEEMEGVMQLSVPLVAEAHWGKNWLEAKG